MDKRHSFRFLPGLIVIAVLVVFVYWRSTGLGGETPRAEPAAAETRAPVQATVAATPPSPALTEAETVTKGAPSADNAPTEQPTLEKTDPNEYVLREEIRQMSPSLAELGATYEREPFDELDFPLFDGESITLTHLQHQKLGENEGIFTAKVKGDATGGNVVLSYYREAVSGVIQSPQTGLYYTLRTAPIAGQSYLVQLKPDLPVNCGVKDAHAPAAIY